MVRTLCILLMLLIQDISLAQETPTPGDGSRGSIVLTHLTRDDYQRIYDHANAIRLRAVVFRQEELQLYPPDKITRAVDVDQNYRSFNGGEAYFRFCFDYSLIDDRGYCRNSNLAQVRERVESTGGTFDSSLTNDDINIRNQMLDARALYTTLLLAEPANLTIDVDIEVDGSLKKEERRARDVGAAGILELTREIVSVHLTFGSEYLADATDYRFGTLLKSLTAQAIIDQEMELLREAEQQFRLANDIIYGATQVDAAWPKKVFVANLFTSREYELYAVVIDSWVKTLDEQALRYRQLREDARALEVYENLSTTIMLQSNALAEAALETCKLAATQTDQTASTESDINDCQSQLLRPASPRLAASVELLINRASAIREGLNPFGYTNDAVPLQIYGDAQLPRTLRGQAEDFLRLATDSEREAYAEERTFDQFSTDLDDRLLNIDTIYSTRLIEICGLHDGENAQTEDFASCMHHIECEGPRLAENPGEMKQNYCQLLVAQAELDLIDQQISNLVESIILEQMRSEAVVQVTLEGYGALAAVEIARGIVNSVRTTETTAHINTLTMSEGFSSSSGYQCSIDIKLIPNLGCSVEVSETGYSRFDLSDAYVDSVTTTTDPEAILLAELARQALLIQGSTARDVEQINSAVRVRTMLLDQAILAIEKRATIAEYNRLAARHNHLAQQYHHWRNLRSIAQKNLVDSYLNNTAYRILREQLTLDASRNLRVAAEYAYLAAKALEYEYLTPLDGTRDGRAGTRKPNIDMIFRARTSSEIRNFLTQLDQYRLAKTQELGVYQRDKTQYEISIRHDVFAINDSDLNDTEFQERLNSYFDPQSNILRIPFTTSLDYFDYALIWNHRIAPVDTDPIIGCNGGCRGIEVNIAYNGQSPGNPLVRLEHGGVETFVDREGNIVTYSPGNLARNMVDILVGYGDPDFRIVQLQTPADNPRVAHVTAVINCGSLSSDRQTCGSRGNSELFNLSPATSAWVLIIDFNSASNRNLKLEDIDDIIIYLDVTRMSRPN